MRAVQERALRELRGKLLEFFLRRLVQAAVIKIDTRLKKHLLFARNLRRGFLIPGFTFFVPAPGGIGRSFPLERPWGINLFSCSSRLGIHRGWFLFVRHLAVPGFLAQNVADNVSRLL